MLSGIHLILRLSLSCISIKLCETNIKRSGGGTLVRTLPAASPKQYLQTPSFIKVGVWAAGDSDEPGVVQRAGGPTQ